MRATTANSSVEAPALLSPAFIAEGCFVHVSGQGPLVNGQYERGSIDEETRQTFPNLASVLQNAGSSLERVVRCSAYLADIRDLEAFSTVWEQVFDAPRPARTTIQAAALPGGIKVEVACIALLTPQHREQLLRTANEVGDRTIDVSIVPDWTSP